MFRLVKYIMKSNNQIKIPQMTYKTKRTNNSLLECEITKEVTCVNNYRNHGDFKVRSNFEWRYGRSSDSKTPNHVSWKVCDDNSRHIKFTWMRHRHSQTHSWIVFWVLSLKLDINPLWAKQLSKLWKILLHHFSDLLPFSLLIVVRCCGTCFVHSCVEEIESDLTPIMPSRSSLTSIGIRWSDNLQKFNRVTGK